MAETVSEIAVRLGADATPLKRGLKDGTSALSKFGGKAKAVSKNMAVLSSAAVAAGAAIGVNLVAKSLEAVDAQAKLAKQIGSTSKEVATLTRAGELAGVSVDQIRNASLSFLLMLERQNKV